jgi:hypothetical protein
MNLVKNRLFSGLGNCCLVLIGIVAFSGLPFHASGQNATSNQSLTPDQQAAKAKEQWSKALNDVRRNFQNNNDRESAEFAGKILDSLDQPGGLSPSALAADRDRICVRVRELVRQGVLESAATFQELLFHVPGVSVTGPAHPNHKAGGSPGPGGLVLYLPFDKPDDHGVIHDESGAGNDGRVFGAQWVSQGKFGGAYRFHFTNFSDRIVIPNSDTLNPDYITMSAWIKPADRDGFYHTIMDKSGGYGYSLALRGDYSSKAGRGKLQFEIKACYLSPDRTLDDGLWHFIASAYDGKTLRCYIDGMETSRPAKNPGPLNKRGWDLCIGNKVGDVATSIMYHS